MIVVSGNPLRYPKGDGACAFSFDYVGVGDSGGIPFRLRLPRFVPVLAACWLMLNWVLVTISQSSTPHPKPAETIFFCFTPHPFPSRISE